MSEEQINSIIQHYLKENLKIRVDVTYDNRIAVEVILGGQTIATDWDEVPSNG